MTQSDVDQTTPKSKDLLRTKVGQLMDRAEQIKTFLQKKKDDTTEEQDLIKKLDTTITEEQDSKLIDTTQEQDSKLIDNDLK